MESLATIIIVIFSLHFTAYSFNIDTNFPIIQHQLDAGYFGYSVAQHEMPDGSHRLVIGAPLAGLNQTGAIYNCQVDIGALSADCQELIYPETQGVASDAGHYTENKTDMWLGVSLRSGGKGHSLLACAHRYQAFDNTNNLGLGICYRYNSELGLTPGQTQFVAPCVNQELITFNAPKTGFGLCQAGLSHDLWEDEAVIGMPGALTWSGSSTWAFVGDGRSYKSATINTKDDEAAYIELGSYFGSATAIAWNMVAPNRLSVAIGAPRHGDTGRVHVFTMSNLEQHRTRSLVRQKDRTLIGEQFGSSFGQTLSTIDIKNNSDSSLVVGAPYYRSNSTSSIGGAIYIYYNYGNGILPDVSRVILTPGACTMDDRAQCYDAMFGHAITSLADINGDGLHDLAVGAPYYGGGAVFIYNGQLDGTLNPTPAQVVMASILERPDISGFGISLSGGSDIDGEGYTDLLVGAFKSSHAVLLRSRLVVTISGWLTADDKSIDTTGTATCNELNMPCTNLQVCFNYTVNQPRSGSIPSPAMDINYNLTLDSGYEFANSRRLSFRSDGPIESTKFDTVSLSIPATDMCLNHTIYIQKIQDITKSMVIDLKYSLIETAKSDLNEFPILNKTSPKPAAIKLEFKRDCQTEACDTDLGLRAEFTSSEVVHEKEAGNNTYVFSSNQVEQLAIKVTLTVGKAPDIDHAYEPELVAILPSTLGYKSFESSNIVTQCEELPQTDNTTKIECVFGRKMDRGSTESVTFKLDHENLSNQFSTISFGVITTSRDTVPANNRASLRIRVVTVTDLEVVGSATAGDEVPYGSGEVRGLAAIQRDDEIGDFVQHTYTLYNNGNGRIPRVTFTVQWPYEVPVSGSRGHYLLYMIGNPVRTVSEGRVGRVQCATIPGEALVINPENFQLVDDEGYSVIGQSGRRKREVGRTSAIRTFYSNDGNSRKVAMLNCRDQTARCFNYTCDITDLRPFAEVRFSFNARLWNSTLLDLYGSDVSSVEITSQASVTIDPGLDVVQNITSNDYANVTTVAIPDISLSKRDDVPYWIYILAAVGGLLLLVVVILLFWKCGFFERHRPMRHAVTVDKKEKSDVYQAVSQAD